MTSADKEIVALWDELMELRGRVDALEGCTFKDISKEWHSYEKCYGYGISGLKQKVDEREYNDQH